MAERPEDLNLPNAVVSRIIKEALPPSVKVSKEAQAAVAKAASVFVLYATSCANNVAIKGHRKTINGNDVIKAMEDMEFNKFIDPLENSLESKSFFITNTLVLFVSLLLGKAHSIRGSIIVIENPKEILYFWLIYGEYRDLL